VASVTVTVVAICLAWAAICLLIGGIVAAIARERRRADERWAEIERKWRDRHG
jgi:exosortase/archaeosortase